MDVATGPTSPTAPQEGPTRAVAIVLLALAYFATGWVGLLCAAPPGNVTALWPPSGIALAAVLAWGRRVWPGVLIGAFATNLMFFPALGPGWEEVAGPALIACGSTVEILVAGWLVERFAGGRGAFDSPARVFALALSCAAAAAGGALSALAVTAGLGGLGTTSATWFVATWSVGDLAGMLVLLPLFLGSGPPGRRGRPVEVVALALGSLGMSQLVFGLPLPISSGTSMPFAWAVLPIVMWAGLRHGSRVVGGLAGIVHVVMAVATVSGKGPLSVLPAESALLVADLLLLSVVLTGLLLAGSATQAWRTRVSLEEERRHLEEKVAERTRRLEEANRAVEGGAAEREHLTRQLLEAQKQEAIGRLAGGVAHDFNNLLTAIGGEAEMLTQSPDPEAQDSARAILAATDRAAVLTRQLLAVARRQPGEPRDVDVSLALTELCRLLRPLLPESVVLDVDPGPPGGVVRIDPVQLDQVLLNLAINARDAMSGGGSLRIHKERLVLGAARADDVGVRPGEWVCVEVTDTGEGIADTVLPHIFEPFFTTKPGSGGTGLGLPTAWGIVAQAGGTLRVRSTPGRGTTFSVWLPEAQPEAPAEPSEARVVPVSGHNLVVLVVEDEPLVRRLVAMSLERAGHRVLLASDGEEGLALARRHRDELDLIVTDVVMPRMGGPEMVRRLRQERPVSALFISGYHEQQAELAGEPFLAKPFGVEELRSAVAEVLHYTPR